MTKDKEKLQNINDATSVFEDFLRKFELSNLGKENRAYLSLSSIEALLPLKEKYEIKNSQIDDFLKAYKKTAKGEYKNLRTVSSGEDQPTWDIVRNKELKKLLKSIDENKADLWEDNLPTKEHMEIILWAYSPDASKIKKNISFYEEKLGRGNKSESDDDEIDDDDDEDDDGMDLDVKKDKEKKEQDKKTHKRKSSADSSDEESPKKKSKSNE